MTQVAIVGAGIAGLACARQLSKHGIACTLFDKGKRPGGRLASVVIGDMAWDLGAQHFTATDRTFVEQTEQWLDAGWVKPWPGGPPGAFVGVPAMASLVAAQCSDADARYGRLVQSVERDGAGWHLAGSDFSEGPFAALAIAVPAEQATALLSLQDLELARDIAGVRSAPCWTVMASFAQALITPAAVLEFAGPLAKAVRNNSKPGRGAAECWVLQASADWSRANLELSRDEVPALLLEHFAEELQYPLPDLIFSKAHRWRFALPVGQQGVSRWNAGLKLGACGDWCIGPTIEEAWLSGNDLGLRIASAVV